MKPEDAAGGEPPEVDPADTESADASVDESLRADDTDDRDDK